MEVDVRKLAQELKSKDPIIKVVVNRIRVSPFYWNYHFVAYFLPFIIIACIFIGANDVFPWTHEDISPARQAEQIWRRNPPLDSAGKIYWFFGNINWCRFDFALANRHLTDAHLRRWYFSLCRHDVGDCGTRAL